MLATTTYIGHIEIGSVLMAIEVPTDIIKNACVGFWVRNIAKQAVVYHTFMAPCIIDCFHY